MFFKLVSPGGGPADARHDERLIALAAEEGPTAMVWQAQQGLVVPRNYQRYATFGPTNEAFARGGWPVTVRQSGGGIVPQGPGIINFSLAYAVDGKPLDHSDQAYQLICDLISDTLAQAGVACRPQAVEGSFCDGRYNLAVDSDSGPRKIAGTAQLWRRHTLADGSGFRQVVLVHALIIAQADIQTMNDMANRYEAALGSDKRYQLGRLAQVADYGNWPTRTEAGITGWLMETLAVKTATIRPQ
ncbi:lipoyl protein ligase domain-containing protein [Pollutimonas thiosulfatoxidans]|uniref:BPL/LPL catalytic domain-containing protein n=1 Tax=Pollutimonas thiosulfatoxidans TaxID=2028345 RepID=A0A410G9A9_9BURK|nr:lipoate--protein ligase family protein [Pollutimonas thiosulfatoxidans]MBF6615845.1 lipoate--protein ligase family protein [Candidimonas sp.]NYT43243.1 lipoate--protein ligase family protein [Alcaligenaceae bacterium]QAA92899.1 hypothetical protein CKA81_02855 [Pollutimonas thiosulfatoxidans]